MVHCPGCKTARGNRAGMTGLTCKGSGNVVCRIRLTHHHSRPDCRTRVAAYTVCSEAGMVHRPGCEAAGSDCAGMARLARCRRGNVGRWFTLDRC